MQFAPMFHHRFISTVLLANIRVGQTSFTDSPKYACMRKPPGKRVKATCHSAAHFPAMQEFALRWLNDIQVRLLGHASNFSEQAFDGFEIRMLPPKCTLWQSVSARAFSRTHAFVFGAMCDMVSSAQRGDVDTLRIGVCQRWFGWKRGRCSGCGRLTSSTDARMYRVVRKSLPIQCICVLSLILTAQYYATPSSPTHLPQHSTRYCS